MLPPRSDGKPGKGRHHGNKKSRTSPRAAREAGMEEEALPAAPWGRDGRTDDEHPFRTLSRENNQWRKEPACWLLTIGWGVWGEAKLPPSEREEEQAVLAAPFRGRDRTTQ